MIDYPKLVEIMAFFFTGRSTRFRPRFTINLINSINSLMVFCFNARHTRITGGRLSLRLSAASEAFGAPLKRPLSGHPDICHWPYTAIGRPRQLKTSGTYLLHKIETCTPGSCSNRRMSGQRRLARDVFRFTLTCKINKSVCQNAVFPDGVRGETARGAQCACSA